MGNDIASIRAHYAEVRCARQAYIRWRADLHRTRMRRAGNPAAGGAAVKGGSLPNVDPTSSPTTGASIALAPAIQEGSSCDVAD
jgi:hypothetical protein